MDRIDMNPKEAFWVRVVVLSVVGIILVVASLVAGAPSKLPALALGAVWLLHVERVVAGTLALSVVAAIGVRLARGELPLKLSATSLEFEALKRDAADSLDDFEVELAALRKRVQDLDGKG